MNGSPVDVRFGLYVHNSYKTIFSWESFSDATKDPGQVASSGQSRTIQNEDATSGKI